MNAELLKPRRKVVADYPNSPFRIGDILTLAEAPVERWDNNRTGMRHNIEVDLYPHLFRKLEWYEERDEKDMPEYVKSTRNNKIFKLEDISQWQYAFYLPATEAEYNDYLKSKQP